LGNYFRANAFEAKRNRGKIGRPTDKAEWGMTPPTVNAFALWQNPSMDFAAGILQPPFYDRNSDLAGNFGAIGSVEGHELTHHFDDVGGQYDLHGNLNDWWSKESADSFKTLTGAIRDEYSQFPIFPGALDSPKLNGQLTLGENTADNGGIRLAYAALQAALAGGEQKRDLVEGFTPEQRFFISYGQVWCENRTPDFARQLVASDPHSPGRYRVNGVVTNMPEFQQAFACKAGDPMAPEKRNRVW